MPANLLVQVAGNQVCVSCKDRAIDKLRMRVPLGGIAWRDGKNMVVVDGAQLPDQCIKCSLPAGGGRMKRKIYWHPPLVYIVLLFNILIYAIVALCVRKSVKTDVGFCGTCRSRRRLDLLIGWLSLLGGIAVGIAVGIAGAVNEQYWGLAGLALFLFGVIWLIVRTQVLLPARIKDGRAWIKGCHKDYLARLPQWTEP